MTPDHGFDFHASLNVSENPAYGAPATAPKRAVASSIATLFFAGPDLSEAVARGELCPQCGVVCRARLSSPPARM
jgi:hypothetical protein